MSRDKKQPKRVASFLDAGLEKAFGKTGEKPTIIEVDLELLDPNPKQQRRSFSPAEIKELAGSISERGLIQPVIVAVSPDDPARYTLIAGERRTLAFRKLGRTHIPAILKAWDEATAAVDALIENVQREDLTPFELAYGILELEKTGLSQGEIATKIGKNRQYVNNAAKLAALPEEIIDDYNEHRPPHAVLQELAHLGGKAKQLKAWERFKKGEVKTRDDIRALRAKKIAKKTETPVSESAKALTMIGGAVQRLEKLVDAGAALESECLEDLHALLKRYRDALDKLEAKKSGA